jgi:hypothetical protein
VKSGRFDKIVGMPPVNFLGRNSRGKSLKPKVDFKLSLTKLLDVRLGTTGKVIVVVQIRLNGDHPKQNAGTKSGRWRKFR